ncbi:MAG: MBL fold metallo-hydrolase [Bacteroidales bacterium]|nr:MBL fold metallo-hydrolase [Bacteroidales bacterium]
MIEICSLASGSNGNCYYIGNETEAIIIDGGISHRKMMQRIEEVGINYLKIRAAFVSHEHHDHIAGLRVISKRLNIPVYFSWGTYNATIKKERPIETIIFNDESVINISDHIKVFPFKKKHDATDPYSFRVEIDNVSIGVITDIGIAEQNCQEHFSKCSAVFLEMNYDPEMLKNGPYPYYLKQRVGSDLGHLSNFQALDLIKNYSSPNLSLIIASHISAENNCSEKVLETLSEISSKYTIELASRYQVGKVHVI